MTLIEALGEAIGGNHRIDETIGEEIMDAKIMDPEMEI